MKRGRERSVRGVCARTRPLVAAHSLDLLVSRPAVRLTALFGVAMAATVTLAACSNSSSSLRPSAGMRETISYQASPRLSAPPARVAVAEPRSQFERAEPPRAGGGGYKLGKPHSIGGVWYVPREEPNYDRTGVGSWYGVDFHGKATANGEVYNMDALTAAHPTLPIPSYVTVTNLANNRTVLVRVNDRGPYVGGRMIDLSRAAARALGYETNGTAQLRVQYAGRAPLNGDDSRERQYLASQPWSQNAVAQGGASVPRQVARGPLPQQQAATYEAPVERAVRPNAVWSPDVYRRAAVQPGQTPPAKSARSSWLPSWGVGAQ
jgi:rare lipoprotein A